MKRKIGVIFALIVVAFLVMGTASAGLFDFLGGDEVQNQTYDFKDFTLEIPEDAVVVNESSEEYGTTLDSFVVTLDNGDSYIIETLAGEIVPSIDDYKMNAGTLGAKYLEDYGDWSIFDLSSAQGDDSNTTYAQYMLAKHDGDKIYQLEANDLDALKALADTFKPKE